MDIKIYKDKFNAAIEHFAGELKKVRTGRAHPDMLSSVRVEVYGTKMPLNQLANIVAPEPTQLLVTPFDQNNLRAIAGAIANDPNLGFNPSDDGRNVRVPIPPLTEERRAEIAKGLNSKVEQAKISLRNVREEARKAAKTAESDKQISQDERKRFEQSIDEALSQATTEITKQAEAKQTEIMTI